jgi:hypothetical protein
MTRVGPACFEKLKALDDPSVMIVKKFEEVARKQGEAAVFPF